MSTKEHKNQILANRINPTIPYPLDYKCFASDDMSSEVKEKRKFIKELVQSNILCPEKNLRWNSNANIDQKGYTDLQKELFNIKKGFSDQRLLPLGNIKYYQGVETRNLNYYLWNNSVKFDKKALNNSKEYNFTKSGSLNENNISMLNSVLDNNSQRAENKKYIKDNYISPIQQTELLGKSFREIKSETKKLRKEIRKKVDYEFPNLSKEALDYKVFKSLDSVINSSLQQKLGHRKHHEHMNNENKHKVVYIVKDKTFGDIHSSSSKSPRKVNDHYYTIKKYPFEEKVWNKKDLNENRNILERRNSNSIEDSLSSNKPKFKLGKKLVKNFLSAFEYEKLSDVPKFVPILEEQPHKTLYNFYHSGKWGTVEYLEDKKYWSCCMNENEKSKGCCKEYVSGGRFNKD